VTLGESRLLPNNGKEATARLSLGLISRTVERDEIGESEILKEYYSLGGGFGNQLASYSISGLNQRLLNPVAILNN
jgi:hypothetical protein